MPGSAMATQDIAGAAESGTYARVEIGTLHLALSAVKLCADALLQAMTMSLQPCLHSQSTACKVKNNISSPDLLPYGTFNEV